MKCGVALTAQSRSKYVPAHKTEYIPALRTGNAVCANAFAWIV